jgi:putative GTP pyrophosphokinase
LYRTKGTLLVGGNMGRPGTARKLAMGLEEEQHTRSPDPSPHEQAAISAYLRVQPFYQDLASVVARLIQECLKKRQIKVHSVQHRAKDISSFGRKAAIPSDLNPDTPRYGDPLKEITDLAGVRVITHFPSTVVDIDRLLIDEFDILERSDKGIELIADEKFGYQSIHYLVRIKPERTRLAEYERFEQAVTEIQVRTILQHAWAEIEHDIQYKSANTVQRGNLGGVEITPNALKLFLDKRLGPDGRMSDWSYDWSTRLLKRFGFQDLKQVETAIASYDDDKLSHVMWGGRQGQINRFEAMLLAALGERYVERHSWRSEYWEKSWRRAIERFVAAGIPVGTYDPTSSNQPL